MSSPPRRTPGAPSGQLGPWASALETLCSWCPKLLPRPRPSRHQQLPSRDPWEPPSSLQTPRPTIPQAPSRAKSQERPVLTNQGLGPDAPRVQVPGPPRPSCASLNKSLSPSGRPSPHRVCSGNNRGTRPPRPPGGKPGPWPAEEKPPRHRLLSLRTITTRSLSAALQECLLLECLSGRPSPTDQLAPAALPRPHAHACTLRPHPRGRLILAGASPPPPAAHRPGSLSARRWECWGPGQSRPECAVAGGEGPRRLPGSRRR